MNLRKHITRRNVECAKIAVIGIATCPLWVLAGAAATTATAIFAAPLAGTTCLYLTHAAIKSIRDHAKAPEHPWNRPLI